ncbi:MAG: ATP-dependent helicase [Acidimicrobiia bacterium]
MDADRFVADLDESQRRAVVEPTRPLAILAPAGSGKTRVLTRRIAWQSATEAIDASHVLALTFTRKAAGELRTRLRRLGIREELTAGTFHAVALAQLRARHEHHGTRMPELLDRKARVLAPLIGGRRGPELTLAVTEVAGEIEWAQARLAGPGAYADLAARTGRSPSLPLEKIADVYRRYQDEKRSRGVIDFDDLVRLTAVALEQDAEFAATQRWRFRHLFVDEFQDVSRAQLRLLRAWLGDRDDLCVVGDPDQAIYSFAGADSRYLSAFAEHFPGSTTVRLEMNYRSTPEIVEASRAVLSTRERAEVRAAQAPGPAAVVTNYPDGDAEAIGVAERCRRAHSESCRWSDMAILYRVNAQSAGFEEALRRAGVPFRVRGDRAFLDRPEVRTALDALRDLGGESPRRGLSDLLTDLVMDGAEKSEAEQTHREAIARLGHEFLAVAGGGGTVPEFLDFLRTSLRGHDDGGVTTDAVDLVTFHRAKGLEWATVFVTGLERGLVPISHAHGDPAALAEERRLLYVALSRAGRHLEVSWASARDRGTRSSNRTPSPYLAEIERAVTGAPEPEPTVDANRRGARAAKERLNAIADSELSPDDRTLLDALVAWRRDLARAAGVPAYVVFDNKVLRAVASSRPRSRADLLEVPGVGPVKLERYGAAVLEIVGRHAAVSAG